MANLRPKVADRLAIYIDIGESPFIPLGMFLSRIITYGCRKSENMTRSSPWTITLLLLLLVSLLAPHVLAAGSLSVTPSSVKQTIPDDKYVGLLGSWTYVRVTNTGNAAVKDISAASSGMISSWINLLDNPRVTLDPGKSAGAIGFYVKPPSGQPPGIYTGMVTYSGTDTSSGKTVSASVSLSITVPRRAAWSVQGQRICTGWWPLESCNYNQSVKVGDVFKIRVDVINRGNVPVTNIAGVLTLPSGFTPVTRLTQTIGNLDNGNQGTIEWQVKSTQTTSGKWVGLGFTVSSSVGSKALSVRISVTG